MPDTTVHEAEPLQPPALSAGAPAAGAQTRTDAGHALPLKDTAQAAIEKTRFKWLERIKRFVRHPLTQLIVAIILIITSLIEASETFIQDLYNFKLRASHGLLVVGIMQVLAAVPDLVEGLERYLETTGGGNSGSKGESLPHVPPAQAG